MASTKFDVIVGFTDHATKGVKGLQQGLDNLESKLKKHEASFKKMAAVGTAGFAAISAAVITSTQKLGQNADRLLDLEQITGISTNTLQEFQQVSREAGVSQEALTDAVSGLNRRIKQLDDEASGASQAFQTLGVKVKGADGGLRATEDIMLDTIIAMGQMDNALERGSTATEIFGRRWEDLAPIAALGAEGIEEARQRARDLGLVLDGDLLEAANETRIAFETMKAQAGAVAMSFAASMLPVMDRAIEVLTPLIQAVQKFVSENEDLVVKVTLAAGALFGIVGVLGTLGLIIPKVIAVIKVLGAVIAVLTSPIALVVAAIAGLAYLVYKYWDEITEATMALVDSFYETFQPWIDWFVEVFEVLFEIISSMWEFWFGHLSKVFSAFWSGIKAIFDLVSPTLTAAFQSMWDGIANVFTLAIEGLKVMVKGLINGIISMINRALGALNKMGQAASKIPGVTIPSIPKIPMLAEGGIVTKPTLAMIGEGGESEAVIPLSKLGQMGGGGVTVNINGNVFGDRVQFERMVDDVLVKKLKMNLNLQ